ncbi:MAG: hypothetical protein IT280_04810 [Ignavibacteria bacterium]|nr:hypothetical protein [Ignavibacteria bacterium]
MSVNKYFSYRYIVVILLYFNGFIYSQNKFTLQPGTSILPVDEIRAKELITTKDAYTAILSRFDLMSKCKNINDTLTIKNYLIASSNTVNNWNDEEIAELKKITESVSKKIKSLGLNLNLPEQIELIKSDMNNEGGAEGYTRQNFIVLPGGYISENTFIHELFHILSRYDTLTSEKVYNSLGFKKCNEVPYPPEISDFRISNPDAPFNNFYINVNYNNKPVDAMLILFSGRNYTGGSFFAYMQLGLMVVEGNDINKKPVYQNGKPLILKLKDVNGFYEQTGRNTSYNIHVEELSADHFVMLLNQQKNIPNPELIETMKNIMTERIK